MKNTRLILLSVLAVLSLASCKKMVRTTITEGTLSFDEFSVLCDETLITKAEAAPDTYVITVKDAQDNTVLEKSYSEIKADGSQVTLTAGNYTLIAQSAAGDIPAAAFDAPIYGARTDFSITAGETTSLGSLTCTLLQVKATVSYDDDFLAMVSGSGKTTLTVDPAAPLEFPLAYASGVASPSGNAGYFAIAEGTTATMNIVFQGNISGKSQKMIANLTGVQPRQWRQIRFIKKADESGNATFGIEINSLVDDEELVVSVDLEPEAVIGEDPFAPKGDGNITLDFADGCSYTDLTNIVVPAGESGMDLRLAISVPGGVSKFVVQISSTSEAFLSSVDLAGGRTLDLINPTEEQDIIFQIVPFPHGSDLLGQTDLLFDLSSAQGPINVFPGNHTFTMDVTDMDGCHKSVPVTLVVNEQ
ncbi:MAG: DUF4493 domain-containing protein [Bacteroidales bacterium]|nr:DUF4493 domain-containing protein [Bacteroidales bacterium]